MNSFVRLAVTLPPLLKAEVGTCCDPRLGMQKHLDILRWLVWLPLLTRDELAKVTRQSRSTLWSHLNHLARYGLLDAVALNETGWPRCHHYHVTDLGLYVLAALDAHPISVSKLAMSYPVTRADLLERLARPCVHLALSSFVTRLIAEHPPGYRLRSYQQPYKETYIDTAGKKHLIVFDAAFLLQVPAGTAGTAHAFYLWVDQPEHLFSQRELKAMLSRLLSLRQARHLQGEVLPHVLILSSRERFSFWAEQVRSVTLPQAVPLLDISQPAVERGHMDLSCCIAALSDISRGAYAPIWIPFHALLADNEEPRAQISIQSLLDRAAAPRLVERFSQYFTFMHVLLRRDTTPLTSRQETLTRYVQIALRQEIAPLINESTPVKDTSVRKNGTSGLAALILQAFYGGLEERLHMSALLTLVLSSQQKAMLAYLARHPYLARTDLLTLLHQRDERLFLRQMTPLIDLQLVRVYVWSGTQDWRARERYALHESALRFLAQRHGLSPAYYLEPCYADKNTRKNISFSAGETEEKQGRSPFSSAVPWVQRGAWGLLREDGSHMQHTSGVYRCIRSILEVSYRSHSYQVHSWKSARESQRTYADPVGGERGRIRPDAEILYTVQGSDQKPESMHSLLIEYDRATTTRQQLCKKFQCYLAYQYDTRSTLPTLLVITQHEQARKKIWSAIADAKAFDVSIIVVLEEDILQHGLLPILAKLSENFSSLQHPGEKERH